MQLKRPSETSPISGVDTVSIDDAAPNPSNVLRKLTDLRRRALEVAALLELLKVTSASLPPKLRACGNWLQLNGGNLVAGEFCNMYLLCPVCGWRRARRVAMQHQAKIRRLCAAQPRLSLHFVTLTLGRFDAVRPAADSLRRAVSSLHREGRKFRRERRRRRRPAAAAAVGAVHFTHVEPVLQPPRNVEYNLHTHAVWICSSKPQKDLLERDWSTLTNGRIGDVTVHRLSYSNLRF